MKRILSLIFALLLFSLPVNADIDTVEGAAMTDATTFEGCATPGKIEGQTVKASADWSSVTFFIGFEGVWGGTPYDIDANDLSNDATGLYTAAEETSVVKVGSSSLFGEGISKTMRFTASGADFDDEEGIMACWVNIKTYVVDGGVFAVVASASNSIKIQMTSDDDLKFLWQDSTNGINTHASSGAGMVVDGSTWYFVEVAWKVSTDYAHMWISENTRGDIAEVSDGDESMAAWGTQAGADDIYLGSWSTGAASAVYVDNCMTAIDSTKNLFLLRNEIAYVAP